MFSEEMEACVQSWVFANKFFVCVIVAVLHAYMCEHHRPSESYGLFRLHLAEESALCTVFVKFPSQMHLDSVTVILERGEFQRKEVTSLLRYREAM